MGATCGTLTESDEPSGFRRWLRSRDFVDANSSTLEKGQKLWVHRKSWENGVPGCRLCAIFEPPSLSNPDQMTVQYDNTAARGIVTKLDSDRETFDITEEKLEFWTAKPLLGNNGDTFGVRLDPESKREIDVGKQVVLIDMYGGKPATVNGKHGTLQEFSNDRYRIYGKVRYDNGGTQTVRVEQLVLKEPIDISSLLEQTKVEKRVVGKRARLVQQRLAARQKEVQPSAPPAPMEIPPSAPPMEIPPSAPEKSISRRLSKEEAGEDSWVYEPDQQVVEDNGTDVIQPGAEAIQPDAIHAPQRSHSTSSLQSRLEGVPEGVEPSRVEGQQAEEPRSSRAEGEFQNVAPLDMAPGAEVAAEKGRAISQVEDGGRKSLSSVAPSAPPMVPAPEIERGRAISPAPKKAERGQPVLKRVVAFNRRRLPDSTVVGVGAVATCGVAILGYFAYRVHRFWTAKRRPQETDCMV